MSRADSALRYFREQENETDARVAYGVEKYRKGDARLAFFDAEGQPLSGIRVDYRQTGHEFRHGANLFMLDEFESEEKNARYRELFPRAFNLATVPFYWKDLEPERGKPRYAADSPRVYRRPAIDLCLDFCREAGIEPKCHCLNYDNFRALWTYEMDVPTYRAALSARFRDLAERYRDVIPSWEVTNETFWGVESGVNNSPFYHCDDFVEWSFREADRYFPNNRLVINDFRVWRDSYFGNRSLYYMQIERLLRQGITHLDAIGFQAHSFFPRADEAQRAATAYNPAHIYEVLDCYARLGKKLQITEMTLPAYGPDASDEEVQAELLRQLYRVYFSHPAMEAVIYWNLPDGYAAFAPMGDMTAGENVFFGGLVRHDLTEKPAFRVLCDLFAREWHTEGSVDTRENEAAFRGFWGTYDLAVTHGGQTRHITLEHSSTASSTHRIVLQ